MRSAYFDEATSSLDALTSEHFAATINQLKGQMTMLFITHALPKSLQVDEIVHIGKSTPSTQCTNGQPAFDTGTV
ncbi:P-loop NTPase family protein [Acidihalobacter prosperus]|uniref:ABC transporter ATP-binding protein n=1 Tax=Acidihalobacter prosperus TaxID=160660 RepID=A0A1A6C792_9GAMM|nr:hypothetical protein [Acidihalobacter prosperus]OBS10427.1 hypothetical protein Thpro_020143 [Acidihalobacter prosperus]